MSRFDDDLRRAAAPLAAEQLPPDILDEAFDAGASPPRWAAVGALVAGAATLVLALSVGIGSLLPSPSPSPSVSPSTAPEASEPALSHCEDVAAPAGGGDVVLVFFPCSVQPDADMPSTARSVEVDLPPVERLRRALVALLDGPTDLERDAGMVGVVPEGSSALHGTVDLASDGLATIDFLPTLSDVTNLSTSAAGGAFLRALRATTLQFDEVTAVEFRLDGSCEAFFEFFQSTCQHFAEPVAEVSDCAIIPPAELPSGAPVGEPRPYPGEPMVSWGSGDDTVTQLPGHRDGGPAVDGGTSVMVRGYPGSVQPTGDRPLPLPFQIAWVEEGCAYQVFVRMEGGEAAALDYAARFGPVMAQPTPPPAAPITATVQEQGIRLTITLDRDQTVYGQRVMATATIENIGADSIYWGHSGTCLHPAEIVARPDDPVPLEHGRDDWPGDEGILKLVSLEGRRGDEDPLYGFLPEEWLDREGTFGCTTDLRVSELPAGGSLVQRRGWDTLAQHGMPPSPGSYTVEATFAFMSRGEEPSFEAGVDDFLVNVEVPLTVLGPEVDYVSPGEAVDALLSDDGFRRLLADAPRDQWVQSSLTFLDDRWELVLFLSASDLEVEPIEALVGTVDARSGIVIDAGREPRTRPPGG